ncbi:MAG: MFS transporter [Oscillospiraceae bacterium]|nr:MFS transporter [Oscillospiraceae bacterium]
MESIVSIRRQKLIIGVVIMLFAGVIYAWSILKTPFIFGDNYTQLGLNFTIALMCFCFGSLLSGVISKQSTSSFRLVLSALLLFSGYFISSFLIVTLPQTQNYLLLYMAYGVLGGLGVGIAYNTIVSTMNKWFPDKRGFCSGLLITGFGLSVLLLGRVLDIMGRSEAFGWQRTYSILAFSMGVVFIIAAVVIRPPPKGASFPQVKKENNKERAASPKDFTAAQMIKKPAFILIFVYTTVLAAIGNASLAFAGDIISDLGGAQELAVTVVGILGVSNGLGRLTSGFLFDHHGIKKTQMISSAITIMAPITVVAALMSGIVWLGIAGLCLCGMAFGFAPTTCSVFASEYFGTKNFASNFSIMGLILIPASFASAITGSIRAETGEFTVAFIILSALAFVAFVVNLGIKKP